jgi:hypothetical protein
MTGSISYAAAIPRPVTFSNIILKAMKLAQSPGM